MRIGLSIPDGQWTDPLPLCCYFPRAGLKLAFDSKHPFQAWKGEDLFMAGVYGDDRSFRALLWQLQIRDTVRGVSPRVFLVVMSRH